MSHMIYTRAPDAMTDLDQIEAALKLIGYTRADRPLPGQRQYTRSAQEVLVPARCFPREVPVLYPTYEYLGYRRTASGRVERVVDEMFVNAQSGDLRSAPALFEPLIQIGYQAAGFTAVLDRLGIAYAVQTTVTGAIEILAEIGGAADGGAIGPVSTAF